MSDLLCDRELTKLAAKAAGITLRYNYLGGIDARYPFDPLNDNSDALSLSVELGLSIEFDLSGIATVAVNDVAEPMTGENVCKLASTRRAIVRAAAEIGRAGT